MISKILERLDGVRATGENRWMARCPAHDDKSPSLSLAERDGKPLIHCFAGCEATSVLDAIGLEWSEILPDNQHTVKCSRPIARVQKIATRRSRAEGFLAEFIANARAGGQATPTEIEQAKACRDILRREQITDGWPFCA